MAADMADYIFRDVKAGCKLSDYNRLLQQAFTGVVIGGSKVLAEPKTAQRPGLGVRCGRRSHAARIPPTKPRRRWLRSAHTANTVTTSYARISRNTSTTACCCNSATSIAGASPQRRMPPRGTSALHAPQDRELAESGLIGKPALRDMGAECSSAFFHL